MLDGLRFQNSRDGIKGNVRDSDDIRCERVVFDYTYGFCCERRARAGHNVLADVRIIAAVRGRRDLMVVFLSKTQAVKVANA